MLSVGVEVALLLARIAPCIMIGIVVDMINFIYRKVDELQKN